MMKALAIDAALFLAAVGDLRHDFEFAVTAFSCQDKGRDVIAGACYLNDRSFMPRVLTEATEKIHAHEGFVAGLLCGVSDFAGPECHLLMLLNDAATSLALKRSIAVFSVSQWARSFVFFAKL